MQSALALRERSKVVEYCLEATSLWARGSICFEIHEVALVWLMVEVILPRVVTSHANRECASKSGRLGMPLLHGACSQVRRWVTAEFGDLVDWWHAQLHS